MHLPSCLFVATLAALGGCSQTGQTAMQASFQQDAPGASAPDSTDYAPDATASVGLASFFAPAPQVQVAQVLEHIPGDFQAPENPPLPPSRPDFGDRVQVAAAPEQPAGQSAPPEGAGASPAPFPALHAPQTTASLPPAQTVARAEAASLGAYEFKTAGVPLPEGGLRATNVAFTPAQFEIAGAGRSAAAGGSGWRAAYDTVETDCFPATLRRALDHLATHFKSEVLVTSGKRERGRRGSMHRSCKAADIRVVGVSPGEVARVARSVPGINGVGTYRRVDVTHVDVRAERFAWRW